MVVGRPIRIRSAKVQHNAFFFSVISITVTFQRPRLNRNVTWHVIAFSFFAASLDSRSRRGTWECCSSCCMEFAVTRHI
jgi:hypothetical protein